MGTAGQDSSQPAFGWTGYRGEHLLSLGSFIRTLPVANFCTGAGHRILCTFTCPRPGTTVSDNKRVRSTAIYILSSGHTVRILALKDLGNIWRGAARNAQL